MAFGLRSFIFTNRQLLKTKVKEPISKVSIKNSRLLIRFVSISETLCFSKGNILFLQEKHSVSQRETHSETSPQISQVSPRISRICTYLSFSYFGCWLLAFGFRLTQCEFCQKPIANSQKPITDSQSSFQNIRVNSRDTRKLVCVLCDFARDNSAKLNFFISL